MDHYWHGALVDVINKATVKTAGSRMMELGGSLQTSLKETTFADVYSSCLQS